MFFEKFQKLDKLKAKMGPERYARFLERLERLRVYRMNLWYPNGLTFHPPKGRA